MTVKTATSGCARCRGRTAPSRPSSGPTLGLFAGAARVLATGALLYLYGPYRLGGVFMAPSNADFDRGLRERDPRCGVRDVDALVIAARPRVCLRDVVAMPANNHSLVFRTT